MTRQPTDDLTEETVRIASEGAQLVGTLLLPTTGTPERVIQINGATGVRASYYRPFAQWLAREQRTAVLIWDYRDFGASGDPRHSKATMTDWAITDPTTVHRYLARRFPNLPRWCLGHSLGGMALAFQPDAHLYERAISIAAGEIHASEYRGKMRIFVYLLWYILGPLSLLFRSHFPSTYFGLGHPLPKGVFWQWRRWIVKRGSLPADPDLGGIQRPGMTCPLTLIALEDDELISPEYVQRMAKWHPNAPSELRVFRPTEFDLKAIGHLHMFSPRNAATWPAIIAPFQAPLAKD